MTVLLVVLGAAVGAPLRYLTDRAVQARNGTTFPWGTFTANVIGCAVLGFLAAWPVGGGVSELASVGFCGALTTYSTFGYETLRLAEEGERLSPLFNVVASIGAGLGAASVGALLAGLVHG
ncbi:fluoride efflux transporter FluC [Actinomadura parmotrematis]|uniref:Fluoride-specific ion channel FluC n=1 Tax=Actinomadura parmotrematis TaxID=2864039 RepID=A0ABS7FZ27_9ACTN|nr:CrcB family protein [Actinomadura parmotrematis]MBW8485698.1 CrcB family protein [Actinomadura parmotrematis]